MTPRQRSVGLGLIVGAGVVAVLFFVDSDEHHWALILGILVISMTARFVHDLMTTELVEDD